MNLPFSASADRNKSAIGDALMQYFADATTVIEIGSGSGQHAVYLSERFAHLDWQPTDQEEYLPGIQQTVSHYARPNIRPPQLLNVARCASGTEKYSFAYSANTAHIMSEKEVAAMFLVLSSRLTIGSCFALYGPFKFNGAQVSRSNAEFDSMLRQQSGDMGIRDKITLDEFAASAGFDFVEAIDMPSNNHVLVWRYSGSGETRTTI
ncbi:hypothetical protein AB833_17040 [Chromatiales bacterium (ex Bugula neritina AB1)]|nr:hypothetical protein AB833_17040 [Chromatiales bacterium (ex Bugula neritina AB1)]